MSTLVDQARRHADEMVRYCPECGTIGPVPEGYHACCPDSFGMNVRRWQAEKMERKLNALRLMIPPSSVQPEKEERRPLTEPELRHVLDGTNNMVRNAMRGPFWPELEEACRAIEAAHGITATSGKEGGNG